MKWKTGISVHKDGELFVRGEKLTGLIATATFPQAIFFILRGKMPDKKEEGMLNAVLVAGIEHGVEAPSAFVPRVVASTGNSVNAALAAGMLAIGDWHGGAIEAAMKILADDASPKKLVAETLARGGRLSGYGHKIYKKEDPRTTALYAVAAKLDFGKTYLPRARAIEAELASATGNPLPLNIDGAIAAILLELGFDRRVGKAFFALSRLPGMIAHVEEEMKNEKPYRRFNEDDVEYAGPELKGPKKK